MSSYSSYDRSTGTITATIDYQTYSSNPLCVSAVSPATLGYMSTYDDNDFTIQMPVDSFVTAMAVNLGILTLDDLLIAQEIHAFYHVKVGKMNVTYVLNEYFDLRYNNMQPLVCIKNVTALPPTVTVTTLCMVGDKYIYSMYVCMYVCICLHLQYVLCRYVCRHLCRLFCRYV